jgi:hypothetical protein
MFDHRNPRSSPWRIPVKHRTAIGALHSTGKALKNAAALSAGNLRLYTNDFGLWTSGANIGGRFTFSFETA